MKCRWHLCQNEAVGRGQHCSIQCKRKYFVNKHRKETKERAVAYKGGRCVLCGYNKCIWAMEFHHIDRANKIFNVSTGDTPSWEKIRTELDKCILLCCNCHRELEEKEINDKRVGSSVAEPNAVNI